MPLSRSVLPPTLALVDDDRTFSALLVEHLCDRGVCATWFDDAEALLASPTAFDHAFYVVDLMLPGVDGIALIQLLRQRTQAGLLVVSGKLGEPVFQQVVTAGADMLLTKPVSLEQVALGVSAVFRRTAGAVAGGKKALAPVRLQPSAWRLDLAQACLFTPHGVRIDLSETDLQVLDCLSQAQDQTATRESLASALGLDDEQDPNLLAATIYRLRRRIERSFGGIAPVQSRARVGYVFREPLLRA